MQKINNYVVDFKATFNNIFNLIDDTDLIKSSIFSSQNQNVYYKLESEHELVKSFKIRGAINVLMKLKDSEISKRLATISSGNNGIALTYASKLLGHSSPFIIVPKTVSLSKIELIEYLGGTVIKLGGNYDEAHNLGSSYINEHNLIDVDPEYSDMRIIEGQGTILLSILKQKQDIDTVIVPIGGGQLIAGIALAIKEFAPHIRLVGVQTKACPAMVKSLEDNICYNFFSSDKSICKALVGGVSKYGFEICKKYLDDIVVVTEKEILDSFRCMYFYDNIIIEPSSATVGAALKYHRDKFIGKNIVAVLTGSNIDKKERLMYLG